MSRKSRLVVRPRIERLDQRCVLSALTPSQLTTAYGLNAITFSNGAIKGTGEGQTIAIVDAYNDPTLMSDLAAFDKLYNLPALTPTSTPSSNKATSTGLGSFTVYNLAGNVSDSGWSGETALDVEWAHAAAPKANIVLVEAASTNIPDLIFAVNATKSLPSVSVISMSWGTSEFASEKSYDSAFTTPAGHQGITFVSSSGDDGAGSEWPSSSPNVVSVGGTSLYVASSGTRSSETAWSGSGGGYSQYEAEPNYQKLVQISGHRSTPDVSMDADPNTGVIEITGGQQVQVGGTSLSSPLFGATIAIANQGLAIAGKGTLNGPSQTLPALYAAPAAAFNDITSGGLFRALTGYDTVSGRGSPVANTLVKYLTTGTTSTTPTVPTTPTPPTAPTAPPSPTQPPTPPHRWQSSFTRFLQVGIHDFAFAKPVTISGTMLSRPFWF